MSPIRAPARSIAVRFAVPEFTSLCPVTGQPDFAHLVIDYAPGETIVESKSLKLFLGAFRNHCRVPRGRDCRHRPAPGRRDGRRHGCASAATGIRAAASRSTCSGRAGAAPEGLWLPDSGRARLSRAVRFS